MARILVLYYSSYGHTSQMAEAVASGVREGGAECDICRVPETAPAEIVENFGFSHNEAHPLISGPDALGQYDGVIFGAPTRFGRMPSQMASFLDTCGGVWASGALIGKPGAAFTSTNSQHGGQEMTLFSMLTNMLHFGMTIIGLDYGFEGQNGIEAVKGGTPYGASTIAGPDGSRQPSEDELAGARYLGKRVATTAIKLAG